VASTPAMTHVACRAQRPDCANPVSRAIAMAVMPIAQQVIN
jgi:hypothetical protein